MNELNSFFWNVANVYLYESHFKEKVICNARVESVYFFFFAHILFSTSS